MKIKAPHSVQIGPRRFKIEYKKKVFQTGTKEELSGACSAIQQLIEISLEEALTKALLFDTVFHEFCHGMLYVSGQSERLTDEHEEGLVIMMENYIAPLIDWKSPIWGDWKSVELIPKKEQEDANN